MAKTSKISGAPSSDTVSTASPTSKPPISLVNFPLTPSEIEWLKQQSRLVAEDFQRSKSAAE
jgi:hypothetical protein